MIFDALMDSLRQGELLLVDGGMCRYHLRRDGQLTIYEIISAQPGAGRRMLSRLLSIDGVKCILARCPTGLPSNAWYERRGFVLSRIQFTRTGKTVNIWRLAND